MSPPTSWKSESRIAKQFILQKPYSYEDPRFNTEIDQKTGYHTVKAGIHQQVRKPPA